MSAAYTARAGEDSPCPAAVLRTASRSHLGAGLWLKTKLLQESEVTEWLYFRADLVKNSHEAGRTGCRYPEKDSTVLPSVERSWPAEQFGRQGWKHGWCVQGMLGCLLPAQLGGSLLCLPVDVVRDSPQLGQVTSGIVWTGNLEQQRHHTRARDCRALGSHKGTALGSLGVDASLRDSTEGLSLPGGRGGQYLAFTLEKQACRPDRSQPDVLFPSGPGGFQCHRPWEEPLA